MGTGVNPFNIIKGLPGPVASLEFNRFCRAQKTCFTSKGHCFTKLHLGFTRASLRKKAILIHRFNAVFTCFARPRMLFSLRLYHEFTYMGAPWADRSSISKGRNLRPPWLLGPVFRKKSLNSFFSLYKNPIDLSLNPISSDSDEIGIQTQMFKMAPRARITIL